MGLCAVGRSADRSATANGHAGHVVFGSFNQYPKLNDTCLALWSQVLARLPHARLRVAGIASVDVEEQMLRDWNGWRSTRHVSSSRSGCRGVSTLPRSTTSTSRSTRRPTTAPRRASTHCRWAYPSSGSPDHGRSRAYVQPAAHARQNRVDRRFTAQYVELNVRSPWMRNARAAASHAPGRPSALTADGRARLRNLEAHRTIARLRAGQRRTGRRKRLRFSSTG